MQQKIKYIEIIFRDIFLIRTSLIVGLVGMAQVMWPAAPPPYYTLSLSSRFAWPANCNGC